MTEQTQGLSAAFIAQVEAADEEAVRRFLLGYAWMPEDTAEEKAAEVECILAQGAWKLVSTVADQFAGAQEEPGPAAYNEGTGFALTALYEGHDEPHLAACPRKHDG